MQNDYFLILSHLISNYIFYLYYAQGLLYIFIQFYIKKLQTLADKERISFLELLVNSRKKMD